MHITQGVAAVGARGARPTPTAFRYGTDSVPPTVSPDEGTGVAASVTSDQLPALARETGPWEVVREAHGHPAPA
ncbi:MULTISPECIES: hypothetical protein [Streptomyces]|uniref:hypothetical protein n=1 Tax=Streptomyces TaxID=1883 RepID=UPI00048BCB00|nr:MULTISPECIES: hypothetical protein [unclassified Streptomyces]MYY15764.1 hypothetical protein [Streptomyces sp. SID4912]SCD69357.1 hypothetical protein GA0115241_105513 [Streptomyces sp. DpondAA-D4]